jgi:predicted nuclease with TOPRIM domain
MLPSRITDARNAFDTQNLQAEDMDMGELTREELTARLESMEARLEAHMEARASAADSKIDALKNSIDALKASMDVRFAELDARQQKNIVDLIKWMVGSAIAMMAVGVTLVIFLFGNAPLRQQPPVELTVPPASAPATPR